MFLLLQSYSGRRTFIAAQSPMAQTRNDIWELIWQFRISIIVLLCELREENQVILLLEHFEVQASQLAMDGSTSLKRAEIMPILTEMLNDESGLPWSWKLDQAIDPIVESLPGVLLVQAGPGIQLTLLLFSMTDLLCILTFTVHLYNHCNFENWFCRTLATLSGQMRGWEHMIGKLSKSTTRPLFPWRAATRFCWMSSTVQRCGYQWMYVRRW